VWTLQNEDWDVYGNKNTLNEENNNPWGSYFYGAQSVWQDGSSSYTGYQINGDGWFYKRQDVAADKTFWACNEEYENGTEIENVQGENHYLSGSYNSYKKEINWRSSCWTWEEESLNVDTGYYEEL